jgi:adenylate cyclase
LLRKASILRKTLVLAAVSFALSAALFFSGALEMFELKAFDAMSRKLNPHGPGEEIVIVKVDQRSIEALSAEGVNWPWPRQVYAPMLRQMSEADAVIIDILYTEPSSYGSGDDEYFTNAIKEAGNVYLPVFLTNNEREISETGREFLKKISVEGEAPAPLSFRSAVMPIDPYLASLSGGGNVTIPPDEDGVYRRVPLVFRMGETLMPHFVLDYLIDTGKAEVRDGGVYAGRTEVPLDNGKMLLRYFRKERAFPELSAVDVIRSYLMEEEGGEPQITKDFFRGKAVLMGLTAAGLYDLKPTSISPVSTGVHIHATALENLMNRNFMTPLSPAIAAIYMLVACLFISYIVLRFPSVLVTVSALAGSMVFTISVPAMFFRSGFYMDIIPPSMALVVGFMLSAAYSYATEGRERRFIRRAFGQYMDERLVRHLLENPELIRPGGQRQRVTVFFTDIEGFTTLAERLPAEESARMLHTVLNEFTEVIIRNDGVIDKYIGDSIMAFWGAPLRGEQDEASACRAALQCIARLEEINRGFEREGLPSIAMRVGIHAGEAIVGNLGSDRLFDYTVVGDTVNLASRLEGVNKVFGTRIIVSEETLRNTGEHFLTRPIGPIEVKGKQQPVRIYELMATREGATDEMKKALGLYSEGLELFGRKDFAGAERSFRHVLERLPGDGPSEFYRSWCRELRAATGLTEDWNIIKMTSK